MLRQKGGKNVKPSDFRGRCQRRLTDEGQCRTYGKEATNEILTCVSD